LPSTYIDFRKDWESSSAGQKASEDKKEIKKKSPKNYIPMKDPNKLALKQMKKEEKNIKKAKFNRGYKQRALKMVKQKMRSTRRRVTSEQKKRRTPN
jgi:hypothetical protein